MKKIKDGIVFSEDIKMILEGKNAVDFDYTENGLVIPSDDFISSLRFDFKRITNKIFEGNVTILSEEDMLEAIKYAIEDDKKMTIVSLDNSRREAEEYVTVGDYGVIDSDFITFGDEMIKGRALGSKLSCAVAVEVLKQTLPVTLEVVFTVQREVGCRGAITVPGQLAAEIGFILDGISEEEGVHCHKGAVLALKKSDREDTDTIERLAKNAGIALQTCMVEHSGQEAVFSKSEHVRRSICLGVPVRYQESAAQVAAQSDQEALLRLLLAWIAEYAKGGLYDGME